MIIVIMMRPISSCFLLDKFICLIFASSLILHADHYTSYHFFYFSHQNMYIVLYYSAISKEDLTNFSFITKTNCILQNKKYASWKKYERVNCLNVSSDVICLISFVCMQLFCIYEIILIFKQYDHTLNLVRRFEQLNTSFYAVCNISIFFVSVLVWNM